MNNPTESSMEGRQTFEKCAWCREPAVGEIEVQPAQYKSATVVNPRTGERMPGKELVQRAIVVAVCAEHKTIKEEQPEIPKRRVRRKPGPDQMTVDDFPEAFEDAPC